MSAKTDEFRKESAEYLEILADLVVEILKKSAESALSDENIPQDLTRSLVECLQYVYLHGDSTLKQISYGLGISTPAASQLVDRLVKKGLAERKESENDRRNMLVIVTESGINTITSIRKQKTQWFCEVLGRMNAAERESLTEGLESFVVASTSEDDDLDRSCARCGMKHVNFCVLNKIRTSRANEDN